MSNKLSASEAVYGFAGWLTSRSQVVTMGSNYDAAVVAELVAEFIKANNLTDPSNDWEGNLVHPK